MQPAKNLQSYLVSLERNLNLEIIGIAFLVGFACLAVASLLPSDLSKSKSGWRGRCSLDELVEKVEMAGGPVHVALYRQSGNLHRELGAYSDVDSALKEISKIFRRAKIDQVRIWTNSNDELDVRRSFYSGRGSSEGKKFGGAIIRAANRQDITKI